MRIYHINAKQPSVVDLDKLVYVWYHELTFKMIFVGDIHTTESFHSKQERDEAFKQLVIAWKGPQPPQ